MSDRKVHTQALEAALQPAGASATPNDGAARPAVTKANGTHGPLPLSPEQRDLVRQAAVAFAELGEVVIPINIATKQPHFPLLPRTEEDKASWGLLVQNPATPEQVNAWFTRRGGISAFAIATGVHKRCVIDFDAPDVFDQWRAAVGPLADGIPIVRSGKRGGYGRHAHFRCAGECPNDVKLAYVPDDTADDGRKTAIETRGVGGYLVMPPSGHPDGGVYTLLSGDLEWEKLPELSEAHVNALLDAARNLCQAPCTRAERQRMDAAREAKLKKRKEREEGDTPSPVDEFNRRNRIRDVLLSHGYRKGPANRMIRPGKEGHATSVTVYDESGVAVHFSSNDPRNDGKFEGYGVSDAFDLFVHYDHGGDYGAAVRAAAVEFGIAYPTKEELKKANGVNGTPKNGHRVNGQPHGESGPPALPPLPAPVDAADLIASGVEEKPYIVEGVMREMDVAAMISGAKSFKTFTAIGFALAVAVGRCWLETFPTHQRRILYIDNELRPGTFMHRLRSICSAMGVPYESVRGWFHVWTLRGHMRDLRSLEAELRRFPKGAFGLIVLDSLYKFLPEDVDENSNTQMGAMFNLLDRFTEITGSAILCVHHQPKGDMSGRDVIDLSSGAGAIGRAVDTMLGVRRHEEEHAAVLQIRTRTSADPEPIGLRFTYPTWSLAPDLDVTKLYKPSKGSKPAKTEMPAVDPVREAEQRREALAAQQATAERMGAEELDRFVVRFLTADFRPKKDIIAAAVLAGVRVGRAGILLTAAVTRGKAHMVKGATPRDPDCYANRPPELIEHASPAPAPEIAAKNKPKPKKGKRMCRKTS